MTELVEAAAQRLHIAEAVAAFKWRSGIPIEDPARRGQELAFLAAQATTQRLDPDYVTRVFGDHITATEAIEYSRFAHWKLDPSSVPSGLTLFISRRFLTRPSRIVSPNRRGTR